MSLKEFRAGFLKVTMLALLFLVLESCQKSTIETSGEVNSKVGEKGLENFPPEGVGGCAVRFIPETVTFINANGNSVTCMPQSTRCQREGVVCRPGKRCATIEQNPGLGDCGCFCMGD